jgi:hypothetical protein
MATSIDLTVIWAVIIGFAIIAYVVMDGFDLGIGILFPLFRVGPDRDTAMNSIAPVWDGTKPGSCWAAAACWRRFRWPTPSSCRRCTPP